MRFKITAITAIAAAFMMVGCGDDETPPATDTDTGIAVTDTGMPSTDTGMAPTDTGTPPGDTGGDTPAPLPTGQIDRMGRPAINTALVGADLKDSYNKTSTYMSPFPTTFTKSFNDSLIFIDGLDGKTDWTLTGGTHPLRDALLGDYLVIDTGNACPDKGSYLDVELFVLGLRMTANTTCGGRTLNDDVMDTTLTATVTALKGPVKDNVDAATKPAAATFPYLAAPN
jgi:hypothetical protein